MAERTTINVPKSAHEEAGDVKDRHEESWTDVLLFYASHRAALSINDRGVEVDTERLARRLAEELDGDGSSDGEELAEQIRKLQELLEKVPENTADKLEDRLR